MTIRFRRTLGLGALTLALIGFGAGFALADDSATKTEDKPKVAEVGKKAPPLSMTDTDGKAFDLHDCSISKKDAQAVVMAAAKKFGAGKECDREDQDR